VVPDFPLFELGNLPITQGRWKKQVERAGHEVHVKNWAKPALAFAAENRMDLVVLDIQLPDMNGYDACVELRRLYHPSILPIVILTALNQPKHKILGFNRGAEAYLTKPVQTVDLVGTVAVMLHRAASRRQNLSARGQA
jgi:two-component system sensor histidine kinase ChiS